MSSEPVVRTSYVDQSGEVREGSTSLGESLLDQTRYNQALEKLHGSGVHGWGIGSGMEITATRDKPNVQVLPGIALDAFGRHISLAEHGRAEIGPNADNPAEPRRLTEVLAKGAVMPTAGLAGAFYVTITFHETFDDDLFASSDGTVFQMMHTPWIRLEPATTVTDATDNGFRVVLGRVELVAGNVRELTHDRRRAVSLPAGCLTFWRGATASSPPGLKTENTVTGEIRARAAGGLEITVPGVTDQVDIRRDAGNIAKVCLGADQIVGRRADGNETVIIEPPVGFIRVGAQGVAGTVVVNDDQNRGAVVCTGSDATVAVGTAGNAGDVRVLDNAGRAAVRIDGNAGAIHTGTQGVAGTVVINDAQNRRAVVCAGSDATVSVGAAGNAGDVLVLDNAGQAAVRIEGNAGTIHTGTQGVAGTVVINDAQNRRAVVCAGSDATVSIGAAGNAGDVLVLNNAGQASVRIDGNAGTIHSGAQGVAGTVLVNDVQNRPAVVCTGSDATVAVGTAGNAGDVLVLNNSGQAAVRIDGNAGTIHTGTVVVTDPQNRRAVVCSGSDATVSVGTAGNAGDVLVLNNGGQAAVRIDGNAGTIHTGTVVVSDPQNRRAVVCSGSDATVSVGTAGNAGDVLVLNNGGQAAVRIDGNAGTIHTGTVVVNDPQNRRAVVCTGSDATVSVGTAGNAGDVLVMDNGGQAAVRINGGTGTIHTNLLAAASGVAIHVDAAQVRIHASDLMLDGRSRGTHRALVDDGEHLIINFAAEAASGVGDYLKGVDINGLHLAPHIKSYYWEVDEDLGWQPEYGTPTDFFILDTGLPASMWELVTFCEIGMQDATTVKKFWWATYNTSFTNDAGHLVVRWAISIFDGSSPDWFPSNRKVFWLAFRK